MCDNQVGKEWFGGGWGELGFKKNKVNQTYEKLFHVLYFISFTSFQLLFRREVLRKQSIYIQYYNI